MSLRELPSVDAVLATAEASTLLDVVSRDALTRAIRAVLDERRAALRATEPESDEDPTPNSIASEAGHWLQRHLDPGLPAVVNATGIVLHTNLGRAPLAPRAIEALVEAARGTPALELDLRDGNRGHRDDHVARLLADLTGAEAGMAVNNNAAALLLAVDTLAARREVVVSRGELIEIGGAFRLPDVLRRAGAILREVGTTNRTRTDDYERVFSRRTALVLRVHPSNYRIEGFTEQPSRAELAGVARRHGIPFVEDLGSGALIDMAAFGLAHEPTPGEAIRAGVDLVTFSGDKLLGGPQAGLIVGRADLVERLQRNPLKRALRLDKLILAALRATLTVYAVSKDLPQDLPALGLLARPEEQLEDLARQALDLLRTALPPDFELEVVPSQSEVGSGAQPTLALPSRAVALRRPGWSPDRIAALFRSATPPIIGRINGGRFLLDLRAVSKPQTLVPYLGETTRP